MPASDMLLSSSPHLFTQVSTRKIMLSVLIALVPATAYGIYLYGSSALFLVLASIAASVALEWLFRKITRQASHIDDLSAVVTGLLLALILPPSTPIWMVVLGDVMAIVVAKEFFGGLGQNPFNPALIGRAFLLMSFPAAITTWHKPFQGLIDATTTATPLNMVKQGASLKDVATSIGAPDIGSLYQQLFLGNRAGSVGESSIALILVGGVFLLVLGVIQWIVPVCMLATVAIVSLLFGMDPLFNLLAGGVVFGAFFMATDYSSSPLTDKGKAIYGVGIGAIVVLIRKLGGFPEGVTYAILIMNMLSPYLDKLRMRKYGYVAPKKPVAASAKVAAKAVQK
jgi:Na+-translocating ferredoxin:NAD+ oxidoreductase subunit D